MNINGNIPYSINVSCKNLNPVFTEFLNLGRKLNEEANVFQFLISSTGNRISRAEFALLYIPLITSSLLITLTHSPNCRQIFPKPSPSANLVCLTSVKNPRISSGYPCATRNIKYPGQYYSCSVRYKNQCFLRFRDGYMYFLESEAALLHLAQNCALSLQCTNSRGADLPRQILYRLYRLNNIGAFLSRKSLVSSLTA